MHVYLVSAFEGLKLQSIWLHCLFFKISFLKLTHYYSLLILENIYSKLVYKKVYQASIGGIWLKLQKLQEIYLRAQKLR